jgi:hypothetical protein
MKAGRLVGLFLALLALNACDTEEFDVTEGMFPQVTTDTIYVSDTTQLSCAGTILLDTIGYNPSTGFIAVNIDSAYAVIFDSTSTAAQLQSPNTYYYVISSSTVNWNGNYYIGASNNGFTGFEFFSSNQPIVAGGDYALVNGNNSLFSYMSNGAIFQGLLTNSNVHITHAGTTVGDVISGTLTTTIVSSAPGITSTLIIPFCVPVQTVIQ